MKKSIIAIPVFMLFFFTSGVFAEEVGLTSDGKARGKPFAYLQQQIDAIQLTPGPPGPQGLKGDKGDIGLAGADGSNGLNCWDLNGNGIADVSTEDINSDGSVDVLDCKGPQGEQGPIGLTGPPGVCDCPITLEMWDNLVAQVETLKEYALTRFQKTFGGTNIEVGQSVQQTADGGYIITGSTNSFGNGNYDVYLIKTYVDGNSLWEKTFGGTDDDFGYSVQQTADGGYIITGETYSYGAPGLYLIKTDVDGDSLWEKTFGGTTSYNHGKSVQQTADGGYIITGVTQPFTSSNDVHLIKTDAVGNSLWEKTFGGTDNASGSSVQQTADGGYIITGRTTNGADSYDVYLIKTDADGNSLWEKTFGGANIDGGHSVQQTADGGYIITGSTTSYGAGSYDVYLIKTDANGNSLWEKTFGGTDDDNGYSGQQTADGSYIITGTTSSYGAGNNDFYLVKTDANGNSLWEKTFGGPSHDNGYSGQQTADGGYIITGSTSSYGAGSADVYLIKTDFMGNIN